MNHNMAVKPVVLIYDDKILWYLAAGTRFREIGSHGREFVVDGRRAGVLWHKTALCTVAAVEMPVEVRPDAGP